MNITINTNLVETLARLAEERSTTTETYVEGFINSHLTSQFKQYVSNKVQDTSIDNLASLDEVITTKKTEIKEAYDLANPVVETVETIDYSVYNAK